MLKEFKEFAMRANVLGKACPFCLSTVPLKATRCAHCTSELRAA